jgi:hypothetical protein
VRITNSNDVFILRKKGLILISMIAGVIISLMTVSIKTIKHDSSTTNNAVSITETGAEWLIVDLCSFDNCGTRQYGEGLFINVTSWGSPGDTIIFGTRHLLVMQVRQE